MKKIYNLVKLLLSSKLYIIYVLDKNNNIQKEVSAVIDNNFQACISKDSRESLIKTVGEQSYGLNLETYDPDLFNAYKECDYQIAKSDYLLAELDYYKMVNDPMSGDANVIYNMYKHVQLLKDRYQNFK